MSGVLEIELAITHLPASDYERLLSWWAEHHLQTIKEWNADLETELLKGLEGTPRTVSESWFEGIRERTRYQMIA